MQSSPRRPFELRRSVAGAVAGGAVGALSVWLADLTGGMSVVIVILAIAMVGLGLGAMPALWTYAVAGILVLGLSPSIGRTGTADLVSIVSLILGGPLIVFMAMRAGEREDASRRARESSAAMQEQAQDARRRADDARGEVAQALDMVEQERTRLEEVAEAIPEPLVVYDADGHGRYANRAALRLFGRSFYDRPLDEWGRVAEPRDERGAALPQSEWPQVRGRREAFRRRMNVRLPMSGRQLLVDVEGTPIPDGGCVLLMRDVGKEVDERRRLSRFASFVAHELRNPLAVAKARIELTTRETGLPERAAAHGQRALESVDAAIAILERLELYSRAEAGSLEATSEAFDLGAAAESAIERLRAGGSSREVSLNGRRSQQVVGDRPLTEQAITNLLTNADRYSTPDGPIEIEIADGPGPELRVRDSGPGIADEVADALFHDRMQSGRGLGLGLYLVHAAMHAQGGTVVLEQRRPRAVFLLRWAAAEADQSGA